MLKNVFNAASYRRWIWYRFVRWVPLPGISKRNKICTLNLKPGSIHKHQQQNKAGQTHATARLSL